MYFFNDKQSIIYGGEVYSIYVPPKQDGEYWDYSYEVVETKEKNDINFNLAEAVVNIELEDPDYQPVYAGNNLMYNPSMNSSMAAGILIDGAIGFVASGLDSVDIKITLFESVNGGSRKAVIYMGTYDSRVTASQLDYRNTMSVLRTYSGDKFTQSKLSEAHFSLYNSMTGGNKEQGDKVYDLLGDFSQERVDGFYDKYLSFDTEGNLVVTSVVYDGERVYIVERDDYNDPDFKEVLDITDYVFSSYTIESSEVEQIINSIIQDEID